MRVLQYTKVCVILKWLVYLSNWGFDVRCCLAVCKSVNTHHASLQARLISFQALVKHDSVSSQQCECRETLCSQT